VPQPDGLVPYFAQDVQLALDRLADIDAGDPQGILTGHLDLDRAGVFGVSLGGRIAAESCLRDARLKACLVMDGPAPATVVEAGLRQPTMFLTRDADTMRLERRRSGGRTEHDIATTLGTMRAAYARLSGGGYHVEVPDLFHVNFTDLRLAADSRGDRRHTLTLATAMTVASQVSRGRRRGSRRRYRPPRR
jgi:pimeloyl-ACP methyl ester carboxylesterase